MLNSGILTLGNVEKKREKRELLKRLFDQVLERDRCGVEKKREKRELLKLYRHSRRSPQEVEKKREKRELLKLP